jgi:hypothetical protein
MSTVTAMLWIIVIAKAAQNTFRVFLGFVGHFFAEGITLAVNLSHPVDNVIGMAIGLGED